MARVVERAKAALDVVIGLLFLAIITITVVQVGLRYLFGGSLVWSEELNLFLWVWMIQLGAVRAAHMRIEFVADRLGRRGRLVVVPALTAVALGLLVLLTWGGLRMMDLTYHDRYIAMPWLSIRFSYLALVVAGPLWALVVVSDAARTLRRTVRFEAGTAQ